MDLDREMAEVMGWYTDGHGYFSDNPEAYQGSCGEWHPSTNIAQAMRAVGKMLSESNEDFTWEFELSIFEGVAYATFCQHFKKGKGKDRIFDAQTSEDTPADAICLAAKAAKKALEKAMEDLYCNRPDKDMPELVCGHPLPCPWHTVSVDLTGNPPQIHIPVTQAKNMRPGMLKKLKKIANVMEGGANETT